MPVRVNIVGRGENDPVDYPDDSSTETVVYYLIRGFGAGILKQGGIGVLRDTLASGVYDYYVTNTQQGQLLNFMLD